MLRNANCNIFATFCDNFQGRYQPADAAAGSVSMVIEETPPIVIYPFFILN
jgi:hypothetical protein